MSSIKFIPECLTESHPLPKFQDSALTQCNNKSIADIYACVLEAEGVAWKNVIHANAQDEAPLPLAGPALVNVRLVGWLLIALFERKALLGDTPMIHVAEDVRRALSKDSDQGVQRRGGQYRNLIRNTWKWRCGDALSKPSDYHHTFMDYKEWLDDSREFEERTGVWDESKVANFEALTRDGFACLVIPEAYSDQYIRANPGRFTHGEYACRLESTRIIPQLSDCSFDGDACPSAEKAHSTVSMTVLHLFGLSEFVTTLLAPAGVDHLSNILSLTFALRDSFERLRMWFDVVDKPDQYRIECSEVFRDRSIPHDPLTFRNRAETVNLKSRLDSYPLPDARLLAIHAACASAMNMSGDIRYELVRKSEMESNPTFAAWLGDALTDLEVEQW